MATLKEYFTKDFSYALCSQRDWTLTVINDSSNIQVTVKVVLELNSESKTIAYYIPYFLYTFETCMTLLKSVEYALTQSNDIEIHSHMIGDIKLGNFGTNNSVFSRRVFFYTESDMNEDELLKLNDFVKKNNLAITIRNKKYVDEMIKIQKPIAFISHDFRDKKDIAERIALGLQKQMCHVWYDEFSLKIGDNLRESIEKGLKESKKCILILTPNFLSNNGWTKVEFDSVFTRELIENQSLLLPVWHEVTKNEVYDYSPSLANKFAIFWNQGEDKVINELHNAIISS